MALYIIGDLHLSFGGDKPMEVFGAQWDKHFDKIKADWLDKVKDEDTVILPGDISWAISFNGAFEDLNWIEGLPGKKIIFKGNHDYWWVSKTKMDPVFKTINFVHNTYGIYEDYAICGTRGWICPGDDFSEEDERVYKRELIRLELSIKEAMKNGYSKIIGVLHFPPTNEHKAASGFTEIFERYGIEHVIYGHVHGKSNFRNALKGEYHGVNYYLTSCDYLDFKLLKLLE
ncbi:MAG: serine/threonine protein phosphatase [Clostridiales bacterium 38-18]|nr:MAG: serine/threonine protein phosphatase [Clostridiales bacterium 38-18]